MLKMDNNEKEPILAIYIVYILASRVYKEAECVERLSEVGNCSK